MEILSLDTLKEATTFFNTCKLSESLFETYTHIGGITMTGRTTDLWYWVNSGKRVNYVMPFAPGEPNFAGNVEYCLSIVKGGGNFYYNDVPCFGGYELKFVCQKTFVSELSQDQLVGGEVAPVIPPTSGEIAV
jgi:hypothetical protein